ncbi:MAG TPA: response regulator [Candidatus Methylacidiphilales bacterium]|jgi:signal transduction histidine kinase|nr:response regulator [Candidatus Methylacidiphilales bacterium]
MSAFRILHLEDSEHDCELIQQLLINDGIDCQIIRCENREKFVQALEKKNFDLIFADCTVPQFNGHHALEMAHKVVPEIPFIFVSGTIEEDSAIEALRKGATDYVLKGRLSRLVPAVRRAIAETEEKAKSHEMEQRLRQAQRLEAVGTLAGGIAHDFNNILTIIKGYTSLLPVESGRPQRVREIAETIDRASLRGAELVNQLLAFARKSEGSFTSTDINLRVREITSMLRPALPQNIAFDLQLEDGLPDIHADPGQIDRVLINLSTNARDAMPDGGKLTFSTSKVRGEEVPVHVGQETREYLCLRVTDTGCGMDEATRQHIFEPFFTTKPKGKGTGLGMPVVYGLMQSHNGLIDVRSEPGKGTSISLFFPIPAEPPARLAERAPDNSKSVNGTETVLIVDDEADVRCFLEIMLKSHGYRVLSARDAEAAFGMLPLPAGETGLLFSDVGLPTIDGFELSRRARQIQPGLKTILCSGYTDGRLKTRMVEHGIEGFVPKPYNMDELLQTIRSVLDKEERK